VKNTDVSYLINIVQKEPSRIPPYADLSATYEIQEKPGTRQHLDWVKTFCVAHGAVASITIKKPAKV